jgi:hypothetical protein
MQRLHGFMGLTPSSAHWLMSRASSHAAVAGLRLSGKRRARPGHVPALNPYSCRGPGAHQRDPTCLLGSSGLVRTGVRCPSMEVRTQRCILGCIIFPCHVEPLDLPIWWGWVPFSVWPRGVVRVQHLHTVEEGTPDSGYRQLSGSRDKMI